MTTFFLIFNAAVIVLIFLDLFVLHSDDRKISNKEALIWTIALIILSLLLSIVIYYLFDKKAAIEYLSVYLLEKSLAIDNIFVFSLIFSRFAIPNKYQHRVLFLGILGAIFFRALLIYLGVELLNAFSWFFYIFGAILIYSGYKIYRNIGTDGPEDSGSGLSIMKKLFPLTNEFHGHKLFIKKAGKILFTPLFTALIFIEVSDIIFAIDSVAASFAYSRNSVIIYCSNIMAILGLRSLYFILNNMIDKFRYMEHGVAGILIFIGGQMILSNYIHLPNLVSLAIVLGTLILSVVISMYSTKRGIKIG